VIVSPETVLRWQRRRFREHWTRLSARRSRDPSAPRSPDSSGRWPRPIPCGVRRASTASSSNSALTSPSARFPGSCPGAPSDPLRPGSRRGRDPGCRRGVGRGSGEGHPGPSRSSRRWTRCWRGSVKRKGSGRSGSAIPSVRGYPGEVRRAPHVLGHSALARVNRFLGEVWVNERG
jgi:hypothetical protein